MALSGGGGMPFASQERDPSVDYLLQIISSVLEDLVRAGEQECRSPGTGGILPKTGSQKEGEKPDYEQQKHSSRRIRNNQVSKFNGLHPPSISILYYLQRIARFSGCSNECFVLMLIYIDRLVTKNSIVLDEFNVHRLIISAILLSAKFFDDYFFFNPHFAVVGGLQIHEMNTLELEFLFLIEFNLYVTGEEYHMYYNTLAKMAVSRFTPKAPSEGMQLPLPQPLCKPQERLPLPPEPDSENAAIIPVDMFAQHSHPPQPHHNQMQGNYVYNPSHKQHHQQQLQQQQHLQYRQHQHQHQHQTQMHHMNYQQQQQQVYHPHQTQMHHPPAQQAQRYSSPPGQSEWVHVSPNNTNQVESTFTMVNEFYTSPGSGAYAAAQQVHQMSHNMIQQNNIGGFVPQGVQPVQMVYQDQHQHIPANYNHPGTHGIHVNNYPNMSKHLYNQQPVNNSGNWAPQNAPGLARGNQNTATSSYRVVNNNGSKRPGADVKGSTGMDTSSGNINTGSEGNKDNGKSQGFNFTTRTSV